MVQIYTTSSTYTVPIEVAENVDNDYQRHDVDIDATEKSFLNGFLVLLAVGVESRHNMAHSRTSFRLDILYACFLALHVFYRLVGSWNCTSMLWFGGCHLGSFVALD